MGRKAERKAFEAQPIKGDTVFPRRNEMRSGHQGNYFKFYAARPKFDNELDLAKVIAESPPADVVPFSGLSPQEAAKSASLPPGFKMHVFAAEPEVKQPIAFCLDDRGRVWVAEGYTYPRRRGNPPLDNRPGGADRTKPTPEQLKDIFGGADRILVLEDTDGDHK